MKICKKYGLFTAVAMVAGTVIGSGVFFKAEAVLRITSGDVLTGLLSWIAGGVCMLATLISFAVIFAEAKGADTLSKIAAETVGECYSYYLSRFMNTVYYPSLVSVLAFLSARYTLQTFGAVEVYGGYAFLLAIIFMVISFAENTYLPAAAGKVQRITTVIKLLPLLVMIAAGIGKGVTTGTLKTNIMAASVPAGQNAFFASVSAVLFAYEGWIGAISIGPELKNSRRNLPLALILGGGLVLFVYVFYYTGIMGAVKSETLLNYGAEGIRIAFSSVAGEVFSKLLFLFVAISCVGALNGMTFSLGRSVLLAGANYNAVPKAFLKGFLYSFFWLVFFFKIQIQRKVQGFGFDISEIPVVTLYAFYIPIFFSFLKKRGRSISPIKRITVICGIIASVFTSLCALYTHFADISDYILVLAGIMLAGAAVKKGRCKKT